MKIIWYKILSIPSFSFSCETKIFETEGSLSKQIFIRIIYPIFLNSSFRLTAFNSFGRVKTLKKSAADESRKRSFLEEKYVQRD